MSITISDNEMTELRATLNKLDSAQRLELLQELVRLECGQMVQEKIITDAQGRPIVYLVPSAIRLAERANSPERIEAAERSAENLDNVRSTKQVLDLLKQNNS